LIFLMSFTHNVFASSKSFEIYKKGLNLAAIGSFKDAKSDFIESLISVKKAHDDSVFPKEGLLMLKEFETRQIDKDSVLAYFRGTLMLIEKRFPDALKEFGIFYDKNPRNVIAANCYGMVLAYTGDYYRAIIFFKGAIELDRNYTDSYRNIIFSYKMLKKPQIAQKFEKYLSDIEKKPNVNVNFCQVWRAVKDYKITEWYSPQLNCILPKGVRVVILNDPPLEATTVGVMPLTSKGLDKKLLFDKKQKYYEGYAVIMNLENLKKYFVLDVNQKIEFDNEDAKEFWNMIGGTPFMTNFRKHTN